MVKDWKNSIVALIFVLLDFGKYFGMRFQVLRNFKIPIVITSNYEIITVVCGNTYLVCLYFLNAPFYNQSAALPPLWTKKMKFHRL